MRLLSRHALTTLTIAIATTTRVAFADPNNPTDNDKAAARPLAMEGLRAAQTGNCREAVDKLTRSESLVHAPTTAVPLAQCEIQLGKVIAGTELLNRILVEPLPPNAPPSWAEAKQQARPLLEAAQPRIAKLRIHVDVPPGVTPNPEVTVDGQPVPNVLLDADRPTDPGAHHVMARQTGVGSAEADVTLADGQERNVSLRLQGAAGGIVTAAPAGANDPYGQSPAQPPAASGVVDPYGGQGGAGAAATPSVPGAPWMAFEFGARFAFGVPLGGLTGNANDNLDHAVSNMFVPLWLDAGVRFFSNWYVGTYFAYAATPPADQAFASPQFATPCKLNNVTCSAHDIRFGVDASYHVFPDGRFDPWFGLGFGYEWLSANLSTNGANVDVGASGWEFVNLQGGLDFRLLNGALGVGPFTSLAFTQYSSFSSNGNNVNVTNQTFHEWFMIGARGDYDLKFP
jgi:hypothetical protein